MISYFSFSSSAVSGSLVLTECRQRMPQLVQLVVEALDSSAKDDTQLRRRVVYAIGEAFTSVNELVDQLVESQLFE